MTNVTITQVFVNQRLWCLKHVTVYKSSKSNELIAIRYSTPMLVDDKQCNNCIKCCLAYVSEFNKKVMDA